MRTEAERWDWATGVSCDSQCTRLSNAPGVSDLSRRDGRLLGCFFFLLFCFQVFFSSSFPLSNFFPLHSRVFLAISFPFLSHPLFFPLIFLTVHVMRYQEAMHHEDENAFHIGSELPYCCLEHLRTSKMSLTKYWCIQYRV